MNESICIFRDQPFHPQQQVTCIASLCQDHPDKPLNRFNALFAKIAKAHPETDFSEIALDWFNRFLEVSLQPLMYLYHRYGMAFESHQQNVLLELENHFLKPYGYVITKVFIILKSLQLKFCKRCLN
jgi:siderophore synthetase component